jgi:hypothetical protein
MAKSGPRKTNRYSLNWPGYFGLLRFVLNDEIRLLR